jgi:peptidoglycan/LPS O-acetylase OafA/YrhL
MQKHNAKSPLARLLAGLTGIAIILSFNYLISLEHEIPITNRLYVTIINLTMLFSVIACIVYAVGAHLLIRFLAGFAGIAIVLLFYNVIFIKHELPMTSGYYGPIIFPMGMYIAVASIAYAIGGQKAVKKFTPWLAEKQAKSDSLPSVDQKDNGK